MKYAEKYGVSRDALSLFALCSSSPAPRVLRSAPRVLRPAAPCACLPYSVLCIVPCVMRSLFSRSAPCVHVPRAQHLWYRALFSSPRAYAFARLAPRAPRRSSQKSRFLCRKYPFFEI